MLRDELALIRPLTGGQHATTLLVVGDTSRYVVRAFPPGDDAAAREASVLPRVRSLDALGPRLVVHAQDPDLPVIVTSAIPGTPPEPGLPARTIASQLDIAVRARRE